MTLPNIVLLYLIVIASFIIFLIIANLRWLVKTLRDISRTENQGGYTKLVQLGIMFCLFAIFIAIVIYFFFNPDQVNGVNIILTVVVGWLGAIIGQFFGEKTMENLDTKRREGVKKDNKVMENKAKTIERYEIMINNLKKLKEK